MTLPFRRRHHDDEAPHDRARALISAGFLGPLSEADDAWLASHLERCPECTADRAGYVADRALLQSLRQVPPAPPRDLWARTSAAIEREAAHGRRGLLDRAIGPRSRGVPLGPLAGVAVAAVVLVVALLPPGNTLVPSLTATPPAQVAQGTPARTPLTVGDQVAWLQRNPDGTYGIVFGQFDQVCADPANPSCAIAPGSPAPISIDAAPQSVVLSPKQGQVAVVPADDQPNGDLLIVSVPTPAPSGPPVDSPAPSAIATPPVRSVAPGSQPIESAAGSPLPSASAGPIGQSHAIIHGVVVVGQPAYSPDGQWFAFSARPKIGVRGPDLYVWHVGDDSAQQLTDDGLTYFAGWFRGQIVASTVAFDAQPASSADPSPASPAASSPADALGPGDSGSSAPSASSSPGPTPLELHPTSFLLDPASRVRTEFARRDVWLPSIDPKGRFVVYWSGTVMPAGVATAVLPSDAATPPSTDAPAGSDGPHSGVLFGGIQSLRPATGSLVLDGWSAGLVLPSPAPSGSVGPTAPAPSDTDSSPAAAATPDALGSPPAPSSAPLVAEGPVGTQDVLAAGPLADFDIRFDPQGTRLVVWTADAGDATLGLLRLIVLDPVAGTVDPIVQPLSAPGVIALRGFSIDDGRLAWVTPAGQNGQPSSVQVLAWKGDEFGQVQTVPGGNPQIVR